MLQFINFPKATAQLNRNQRNNTQSQPHIRCRSVQAPATKEHEGKARSKPHRRGRGARAEDGGRKPCGSKKRSENLHEEARFTLQYKAASCNQEQLTHRKMDLGIRT